MIVKARVRARARVNGGEERGEGKKEENGNESSKMGLKVLVIAAALDLAERMGGNLSIKRGAGATRMK